MNKKGQTVMSEYVLIFFVVIAAVAGLTVFVQRGLQARIHDARNYMINSVIASGACDAGCMQAAGGGIYLEYEPYYSSSLSDVAHNDKDVSGATSGNAQVIGAIYNKIYNEQTQTISSAGQLPACASEDPVPLWCQ